MAGGRSLARRMAVLLVCLWVRSSPHAVAQGLPPAKDGWIAVQSERLTLLGNVPERDLKNAATRMSELNAVIGEVLGAAPEASLPTKVFVFKNDRSLRPYQPDRGSGQRVKGLYISSEDGGYAVVTGHPTDGAHQGLLHEWAHHLVAQTPGRLPLWLNEGLAELLSNFVSGPPSAEIGRPKGEHINLLRKDGLLPLDTLFSVDEGSSHYRKEEHSGRFYAQSWITTHFFLTRGKGLQSLSELVERLRDAGESPARRWPAADELAELDQDLERYLWGQVFPSRFVASPAGFGQEERPAFALSRAQLLAELGDLAGACSAQASATCEGSERPRSQRAQRATSRGRSLREDERLQAATGVGCSGVRDSLGRSLLGRGIHRADALSGVGG